MIKVFFKNLGFFMAFIGGAVGVVFVTAKLLEWTVEKDMFAYFVVLMFLLLAILLTIVKTVDEI